MLTEINEIEDHGSGSCTKRMLSVIEVKASLWHRRNDIPFTDMRDRLLVIVIFGYKLLLFLCLLYLVFVLKYNQ